MNCKIIKNGRSSGRKLFRVLCFFVLGFAMLVTGQATATRKASIRSSTWQLSLDGDWKFARKGTETWLKAVVPGCVHTDLMASGVIQDPFFRLNEVGVQWIEKEDWVYVRDFDIPGEMWQHEMIELVAEGIDTIAVIYINGQEVGLTENMFRRYRFEVKNLLQPGLNNLKIELRSPVQVDKERASRLAYKLPGNAPHIRKAPYHFGWDWGPRLVTSGIWRPIYLKAWSGFRIEDLEFETEFLPDKNVRLNLRAEVQASSELQAKAAVFVDDRLKPEADKRLKLSKGRNKIQTTIMIKQPKLWWPAGMGGQNLYKIKLELTGDGIRDEISKYTGIRKLALVQETDAWGRSFHFSINDIPVFAKGANWIPADSFPSRVSREKYEQLLHSAVEANMNMIRVWGGGIYESPDFYDLCDRLGLLVWQDFMFACQMVPGNKEFRQNVREEASDVIKQLRHHPSIVLWCGNNECEEGWFHWGWKESLPPSVWDDYQEIFHRLLPEVVSQLDPSRPYWPSSPHSEKIGEPRSDRSGDMHYWGVWHGREPFSEYRKQFHRFFSEFGFQSFPLFETVRKFTEPSDWNLTSAVMEHHQRHPVGNKLIMEYMLDEYLMPKDFLSTLWLSQVLQAEGMKIAVEHFRASRPRIMGALYWQFQDCWPVASWAGIDYTGTWKALHFYARRFFSPVLVSPQPRHDELGVYLVSDLLRPAGLDFEWLVASYDGQVIASGKEKVLAAPGSSKLIFNEKTESLMNGQPPEKIFFYCEIKDSGRIISSNIYHFSRMKRVELPAAVINIKAAIEGRYIKLTLRSEKFAKSVYLAASGVKGRFLDNFIDVVPSRETQILFEPGQKISPDELVSALELYSLRDTYK